MDRCVKQCFLTVIFEYRLLDFLDLFDDGDGVVATVFSTTDDSFVFECGHKRGHFGLGPLELLA